MCLRQLALVCAAWMLLISTGAAQDAGPAPCDNSLGIATAECGGNNCCAECPPFYFAADALFLNLSRPRIQPVVIDQTTESTLLTTRDVDFDMVAGPRFTFGYPLTTCKTLELTYFGLHDWDSDAEVTTDSNNLRLPGDDPIGPGFADAYRMRLSYSAKLHNAELNYLQRIGKYNFSLLGGFRYVRLTERFDINAASEQYGANDYLIGAKNNLYGGQFGWQWRKWCKVELDVTGKAGLFGNDTSQHTFLGDLDNTVTLRDSTTFQTHTAFVGELNVTGIMQVCNGLYFRCGYNLLWIEGIARAADQLDFTDTETSGMDLVSRKGAFLHGASVGLEYRW